MPLAALEPSSLRLRALICALFIPVFAMRSFAIQSSTARLRYLQFDGGSTPLLMIHGLGCASSFEYPHVALAPTLRGRRLILLDLLGFGYSDRPDDFSYRIHDHALQVFSFIEAQNFERIDIYGHSMGGSVAIETADLLGSKVKHLVLSEANLDNGGGTFSRAIAAFKEADYVNSGHDAYLTEAERAGNREWAAMMRASSALAVHRSATSLVEGSSPDWRSRFLKHPSRKTFIFGERSLPDADVPFLSSSGISVRIVAAAGHSMATENPEGLAKAIAEATAGA
ncbi:alpha/beta fold hydrolase [Rhizobium lusitanum]|uniref:Pimeloyl-ACP methyl ester carboxylesterase n=1 Tax=Rhizobium lusitanum TaxID=293958 RepID=A0A7X0IUX4_9HYPH|nr:alpha/beta hydrolase [Rhizobium lusitanum]MBB6486151.1 pimeloyl-ACP methyl ester carboxylesterase [Rhizobium lusitanum]